MSEVDYSKAPEKRLWKGIALTMIEDFDLMIMRIKEEKSVFNAVFESSIDKLNQLLREVNGPWFSYICDYADLNRSLFLERMYAQTDELDLSNQKIIQDRKLKVNLQ